MKAAMIHLPYLSIDLNRAEANLKIMIEKAKETRKELRPHFKTHQSRRLGKMFKKHGISGITVSSVSMAEYFVPEGWNDITIAFPVSIHDSPRLNDLCKENTINILAVDPQTIREFSEKTDHNLGVYIELDPGYGRSGIPVNDHATLLSMKKLCEQSPNIDFKGFYVHAGHSYGCRSQKEIRSLALPIIYNLNELKASVGGKVCFGDTPSCSILEDFGYVDQISPGNFIFYDWTQTKIGSCSSEQIAVAMMCPVVAKYEDRKELLIHGGAVHFSKDSYTENGQTYFGVVAESRLHGWGNPLEEIKLTKISQEHGTIHCTDDYFNSVSVGDIIPVLPIHSCLTADCMGAYYDEEGNHYDHLKKDA